MNQNTYNRKAQELESIKHKLQKVSMTSKLSKMNVDDYINCIIGSGLEVPNKTNNKFVSKSAQNIKSNSSNIASGNLNNSVNSLNQSNASRSSGIHNDFFSSLPIDYKTLIDKVQQPNGDLNTQKIYEIFRTSGLSNDILGHIWNSVNRTCAGQLTSLEFAVGLAMIALYQKKAIDLSGSYRNYQNLDLIPKWDEIMLTGDFRIPKLEFEFTKPVEQSVMSLNGPVIHNSTNGDSKTKHVKSLDEMTAEQFNEVCFSMAANLNTNNTNSSIDYPDDDDDDDDDEDDDDDNNDDDNDDGDDDWADFSSFTMKDLNSNKSDDDATSNMKLYGPLYNEKLPELVEVNIDNDFGDFQNFSQNVTSGISNNYQEVTPRENNNSDKYKVFQDEAQKSDVTLVDQWLLCLNCCLQIISDIVSVLNNLEEEPSEIRKEIFETEKGISLLSGVVEVYQVTKNMKLSASKLNILPGSESMLRVLAEVETNWNQFMMIIPTSVQTEVHNKLSQKSSRTADTAANTFSDISSVTNELCGVCLCSLNTDTGFLSHGSHKYHCPCANMWVNNLNLTLPGLIDLIPATNVDHIL